LTDEAPRRPAGPQRQAGKPPPRPAARPAETLPGDMKTRAPEEIFLARPQMHPIQRRPKPPQD
jgi:hypothetical protein